ncbi:MAG: patatin-like phospholipase family protein [Candidatus Omnitrophota bacterium]|nr:patatin-like phospholipase family protein [Candidatus Omnitrophota bacterium]
MMRLREKLLIVEELPLFVGLLDNDKRTVAGVSSIVEYKKGEIVYREGDPAGAFYCVITGRLSACITRRDVSENLEYLKRGGYFGIISILTGEPHSVTVQAVNDSIILKIPKDAFERILKRIPALAIHLSQTLSRRLKQKSAGGKSVFESTIISVLGVSDEIGVTDYALNLGIGLNIQTGKRVVLLNIARPEEAGRDPHGAWVNLKPLFLDSPFINEDTIKAGVSEHPSGIDIINISGSSKVVPNIISLLSYLTNSYHYIIIRLKHNTDSVCFELLKQSDLAHIITSSDHKSLISAAGLITELERSSADIGRKIKVITSETALAAPLGFTEKKAALGHDIFAALPDINKPEYRMEKSAKPMVVSSPDCEYSRMVRRISRQIGDCLIGLALGSGAAHGLAHIGILRVIERERIPVDIVAGTSMGALIGALWASGRSAAEIEEIMSRFRTKISNLRLVDLTWPSKGLIKGREIRRFLVSQFGNRTFYDLKQPLKIVACDIERREEVILEKGGLADAVMASVSIPGIFQPVRTGGRILVDGGIINPLPTNVLMRIGVSKIIAVNTLSSPEDVHRSDRKTSNIFDFIVNSIEAGEYLLAEASCQNADIAMHPVLSSADWYEFYKAADIIKRGEEEAIRYLPQLKELVEAK